MSAKRRLEKLPSRLRVTARRDVDVDELAVLVDGPVDVTPPAGHLHVDLVHVPAITDPVAARSGRVREERRETLYPAVDGDVVDLDPTLGKEFLDVAVRTYDDGEVARLCVLGLAPEQPWRCPEGCSHIELSVIDGTFVTGPLTRPPVEDEPDAVPDDVEGVLADAEAIVEHAEPDVIRDLARFQDRATAVVAAHEASSSRRRKRVPAQ